MTMLEVLNSYEWSDGLVPFDGLTPNQEVALMKALMAADDFKSDCFSIFMNHYYHELNVKELKETLPKAKTMKNVLTQYKEYEGILRNYLTLNKEALLINDLFHTDDFDSHVFVSVLAAFYNGESVADMIKIVEGNR